MRRPADEVCCECKRLIHEGKAFDAFRQQSGELLAMPQHASTIRPHLGLWGRNGDELHAALFDLALAVSIKTHGRYCNDGVFEHDSGAFHGLGKPRVFPSGSAKAFKRLAAAIRDAIKLAEQAGKDEGSSIILGLARGKLSLEDFNRETVKGPATLT